MSIELERLAAATLLPGYVGLEPPEWVLRHLDQGLGGVVLYARNVESPEQLRAATDMLREARPDVIVAIDEEGGDVTRLEAERGSSYPGNCALGHVDDLDVTQSVARAMGADLARAGVNVDLAPVADVNTNPDNPIIGIRSFGAEPERVARHVAAFVDGLQHAGVAACAKHFPGHGDTTEDSHLSLPTVTAVAEGALVPFRAAIDAGTKSIMTAHIRVDDLGEEPATVNPRILGDLLREELGYTGLVITDALEMRAISGTLGVEEGAVRALAAGADALCLGHDLWEEATDRLVTTIVAAVRTGRLRDDRLAEAAGRVAELGAWASGQQRSGATDAGVGFEAARRALDVEGELTPLDPSTIVIELRPEPSIAVGEQPYGLGDALRERQAAIDVVRSDAGSLNGLAETIDDRDRVVVVQDAHRHLWQQEAVDQLAALNGKTIVVETGLPCWRPERADAFVATHGSGRACLEAAADRLAG